MVNADLRVEKGNITYHQLANQLGVHHKTVQDWFQTAKLDQVRRKRLLNAIEEIRGVSNE